MASKDFDGWVSRVARLRTKGTVRGQAVGRCAAGLMRVLNLKEIDRLEGQSETLATVGPPSHVRTVRNRLGHHECVLSLGNVQQATSRWSRRVLGRPDYNGHRLFAALSRRWLPTLGSRIRSAGWKSASNAFHGGV